jgi:hypothetical protein
VSTCKNEMNLIQTLEHHSSEGEIKVNPPQDISKRKKFLFKIKNRYDHY